MEQQIKIESATLVDNMFCHFSRETEIQAGMWEPSKHKSPLPVHEDMRIAFKRFNHHLAVICEEVSPEDISDIDKLIIRPEGMSHDEFVKSLIGSIEHKLFMYEVTAVSFTGSGENEGISLKGTRMLSTGDYLGLNSPTIKYADNQYPFINELRIAADDLKNEVLELINGKRAPIIVEEPETEETLFGTLPKGPSTEEKPKRGRKPKGTVIASSDELPE